MGFFLEDEQEIKNSAVTAINKIAVEVINFNIGFG